MNFDYVLADPTGNITVLITSPYTADTRQKMIHEAFIKEPSCEQVGFAMPCDDGTIKLEMMGYEFCGNATLSSAALLALSEGIEPDSSRVVTVRSSGATSPIEVSVTRLVDIDEAGAHLPAFEGTLAMPLPTVSSYMDYPLITFDGISHILVPASDYTDELAEQMITQYAAELGVSALGMILIDDHCGRGVFHDQCAYSEGNITGENDGNCSEGVGADIFSSDELSIRPLVYVPGSDTLVWESGCATGSTALGWYRSCIDPAYNFTAIKQPGGIIRIRIMDGQLLMTGKVIFR